MIGFTDQDPPNSDPSASPSPTKAPGKPKTFKCPSCAGAVTIRAVGVTITAVCGSCASIIDVTNENYRIIDQVHKKIRKTLLEIGARGRLQGIMWEVVGYTQKTDGPGKYSWDEYLLYNPYYGFRFLVEASGHWNIVKVLRQDIEGAGAADRLWHDNRNFALFLRGEAVVSYVKGEFYWRVKKGERNNVADYIAPPYMLSVERNRQEINVSLGEYLDRATIAEAFNIAPADLPAKSGVAANQPPPYQGRFGTLWLVGALAATAAFLVQAIASGLADDAPVYAYQGSVKPGQKDQTFSTPSFNLPKVGNVLITTTSPVRNDWLELEMSLVNEQTNEEYPVNQAIEYYFGSDGGENWSEGRQYAETFISRLPAGDYRLLIDAEAGAFQKSMPADFSLEIKRDVPNWSNFLITLPLLLIYPLFAVVRRWRFESKRWSESDFAPAIYRKSSDDSNSGDD